MAEYSGKDYYGIFGDSTDYYIVIVVGLACRLCTRFSPNGCKHKRSRAKICRGWLAAEVQWFMPALKTKRWRLSQCVANTWHHSHCQRSNSVIFWMKIPIGVKISRLNLRERICAVRRSVTSSYKSFYVARTVSNQFDICQI